MNKQDDIKNELACKDLEIEQLERENNLLKMELSDLKEDLHVFAVKKSDWYKEVLRIFHDGLDEDDANKAKQALDLIKTKIPFNHPELAVLNFQYDGMTGRQDRRKTDNGDKH